MRLPKLLVCILFCVNLSVIAFAHSGGTDENGGHYVSGNGEYHYHHGYPAHDHTDTDGDGIPDCPYQFKDKTGYPSTGSNSTSTNPTEQKIVAEEPIETTKKKSFEDYLTVFFLVFLGFIFLHPLIFAVKPHFGLKK
jgi:hypothetical protein